MYGYLHRGRVLSVDPVTGGFNLQSVGLARTSRWGPVPSAVPGIAVGDRVILGATGTSRDDLVIIAKVGADFPDIGDIPGLQAALNAKADDSEITVINNQITTIENDIDGIVDNLLDHENRLDIAEADIITAETALLGLDARADVLENEKFPFNVDQDLFGDLVRNTDRAGVSSGAAITNGTIYLLRLYTRRALSVTQIRMVTSVAGTVGTATAGLYTGSLLTSMSLAASAAISLTTLGRVTATITATPVAANSHILVALLPLNYSTIPQIGGRPAVVHSSMLNPNAGLASYLTKGSQVALPSTINTSDLTWTITGTSLPWVALGGSFT